MAPLLRTAAARPAVVAVATAAMFLAGAAAAAPPLPDEAAVIRAAYPQFDPATGRTGDRGVACGEEGAQTAHLVAVRPWRGMGRDLLVAAFSIWAREAEDGGNDVEYAQACGPRPAQLFLLERTGGGLRVVARSDPDQHCDVLDLAPYRVAPGETLVGCRGDWMNHGFGKTTLTLHRVAGATLVPVLAVPVGSSNPAGLECTGVVAVVPRAGALADVRVTWKVTQLDDDANEKPAGSESATWRWGERGYALERPPRRCGGD
jgi:hypothetical protein